MLAARHPRIIMAIVLTTKCAAFGYFRQETRKNKQNEIYHCDLKLKNTKYLNNLTKFRIQLTNISGKPAVLVR